MCAGVLLIIVTASLNIIHVPISDALEYDLSCSTFLTDECELTWSKSRNTFVPFSTSLGQSDSVRQIVSSPDTICIRAPERHQVIVQISTSSTSDPEGSVFFLSKMNEEDSFAHETPCLIFRNNELNEPSIEPPSAKITPVNPVDMENSSASPTDYGNTTTQIISIPGGQIERFPRHSRISPNLTTSKSIPVVSAASASRGQKQHRCKKCKKASHRKKRRQRNHKRKVQLFKLLLKYHTLLYRREKAFPSRYNTGDTPELSQSSRMLQGILSPTRSPELSELFTKISRFVKPKSKFDNLANEPDLQRSLAAILDNGLPLAEPTDRLRTTRDIVRNKRGIKDSIDSNDIATNANVCTDTASPPIRLCGGMREDGISNQFENYAHGETSETFPKDHNTTVLLISPDKTFSVKSSQRTMKINIRNVMKHGNFLFQFLVMKIQFVKSDATSQSQIPLTEKQILSDITSRTLLQSTLSTLKNRNISRDVVVSLADNNAGLSHVATDSTTIAVVAAAILLLAIIIFAGVFFIKRKRRRQNRRPAESNSEHEVGRNRFFMASRPAISESGMNRKSSDSPQASGRWIFRKNTNNNRKSRRKKNERRVQSREGEIRMLKCGHRKKKIFSTPTVARMCKEESHRMQMQKQNTFQKCNHLHSGMGLSQHRHCIVCQIAEKPHQPIVGAHYVSEFLPPASQNPNIGSSLTAIPNSPNAHRFDKFNRMQNNPYRQSPNLSAAHNTQTSTISLPDGEELYRAHWGGVSSMPNPSSRPFIGPDLLDFDQKDGHMENPNSNQRKVISIKSPPNRTVYSSDDLPFVTGNKHRKSPNPNGYPGPPSGNSPMHCVEEQHKSGTCKISSRRYTNSPSVQNRAQHNLIHCLDHNSIGYTHEARVLDDKCICKYILKHIKEPPPEYSDVVRDKYPSLSDEARTDSPQTEDPTQASNLCNSHEYARACSPFLSDSKKFNRTLDMPLESTKQRRKH